MAKRGRPPKNKEVVSQEPSNETEAESQEGEKEEIKKNVPTDCRLCANYPLQHVPATTGLSPELASVTKNFTRTFCGTAPANGVNCTGKKFTPLSK
jgi:hypothetical protein